MNQLQGGMNITMSKDTITNRIKMSKAKGTGNARLVVYGYKAQNQMNPAHEPGKAWCQVWSCNKDPTN